MRDGEKDHAGHREHPGRSSPRCSILALGGAAILFCYAVALRAPEIGLFHDEGIYLVTAKALAEGKGYRIVSLPEEIPQTKYPILFPLALSVVWRINPSFPDNVTVLKLVPFAATITWCILVYLLLAKETDNRSLAAGITVLTAISRYVVLYSTILKSETLFAAFAWAALLLLARCEEKGATGGRLFGAALLSGAAFNTRTLGLALIVAGIVALARRRGLQAALKFGFLCAILVAPWTLWVMYHSGAIPELYGYYTNTNYQDWSVLFGFSWAQKLRIIGWNFFFVLLAPAWLMGFGSRLWWPLNLTIGAVALYGFTTRVRRGMNVVDIFVVLYLFAILLWAWPPRRLLMPIYPLVLLYASLGGQRIIGRIRGSTSRRIVTVAAIAATAFAGGWALGRAVPLTLARGTACYLVGCRANWQDVREILASVRTTTSRDAILASTLDPVLYLYTGRKAVLAFELDPYDLYYTLNPYTPGPDIAPLGPVEDLAGRLVESDADYLVAMPPPYIPKGIFWAQFGRFRRAHRDALERVDRGETPHFRLYRIDGAELRKGVSRRSSGG